MLVLITGATGLLGFHTARALLDAGHGIRLLARDPAKARRLFERVPSAPEIVPGDMADRASVQRALDGCDAVVHSAALVGLSPHRANEIIVGNVSGVRNVVGGALERGIERVVYISSTGALVAGRVAKLTEDSPVGTGKGGYSRSKAQSESYVRELQRQGAPVRTIYPSAILGPDDPGLGEANKGVMNMVREGAVMVTSSGFQFVDVRDLARAQVSMLQGPRGSGRYMLGGHYLSWTELGDSLEAITGRRIRRIKVPGVLLRSYGRISDVLARMPSHKPKFTSEIAEIMTRLPAADSSSALGTLGMGFRAPLETLRDTLHWLHTAGHLSARKAGLAAREEQ